MADGAEMTIAITGGIGSGKSVVSRIVSAMGYPVYDCDSRAKFLMDSSAGIKRQLAETISPEVIIEDNINRPLLAEIVFNDSEALLNLNSIVHSAVREDFVSFRNCHKGTIFFETAILGESGFTLLADEIWIVDAPLELRIKRVMSRNNLTRRQVEARITSQKSYTSNVQGIKTFTIVNDGVMPLLQQVTELLQIS